MVAELMLVLLLGQAMPLPGESRDDAPQLQTGPVKIQPLKEEQDKRVIEASRSPIPADGVVLAWADAQTLPAAVRPFIRYIWVPNGDRVSSRTVSYVLNATISNQDYPMFFKPVAGNRLVRVHLGILSNEKEKNTSFSKLAEIWEEIPNFYFRIETSKQIAIAPPQLLIVNEAGARVFDGDNVLVTVPFDQVFVIEGRRGEYLEIEVKTGNRRRRGWVHKSDIRTIEVEPDRNSRVKRVRNFAEHTNLEIAEALQRATQSNNPIVRYDAWLVNTITQENGGNYYRWINIPRGNKEKGITDLDALLLELGVSQEDLDTIISEKRVAMFRSGVTAKPRLIEIFKGLQGTAGINEGRIFITSDMNKGDYDPTRHPIRNLAKFNPAGHEVIWEEKNGSHRYALYNGEEKLVGVVPDTIATDDRVPAPHTKNLEVAISCIRCHGEAEEKGVKPFRNEVQIMLSYYKKRYPSLDVFDDASDKTGLVPEVLKDLASKYSGNLTKSVFRSRNDLDDAAFIMTGGKDGGLTFGETSAEISRIFKEYYYDMVTPTKACKELGFVVAKDDAVDLLNRLLPPLPDVLGQGFHEEDPVIGALKAGLAVNRLEWEQVYVDAMNRTMLTILLSQKKESQQQQEAAGQ